MMEKVFEDAEARIPKIQKKIVDNAVLAGKKDAYKLIEDPATQEFIAQTALREAMEAAAPEPRNPGPARRQPNKVSARKRQRQARKAGRR